MILDKLSNKFRLFGSLPVMVKEFENERFRIAKVELERGGSLK